jgi:hypothetical protein
VGSHGRPAFDSKCETPPGSRASASLPHESPRSVNT